MDDQGTADTSDDRIVGGATFEFRKDDGDGVYEPTGDDAPVLAEVDATSGFAVFTPPSAGSYWITESVAPPGLGIAPPVLVDYTLSPENCGVDRGIKQCVPDDDASGGFLIVVVNDSPGGGVGGADKTPPPTDVATGTDVQPGEVLAAIGLLLLLSGIVLTRLPRRPTD